ncbi:MAG: hypothetical protein RBT39_16080 [Azoarcus sp.]|nr:hypothetical protein [Azoarcus sp.]
MKPALFRYLNHDLIFPVIWNRKINDPGHGSICLCGDSIDVFGPQSQNGFEQDFACFAYPCKVFVTAACVWMCLLGEVPKCGIDLASFKLCVGQEIQSLPMLPSVQGMAFAAVSAVPA